MNRLQILGKIDDLHFGNCKGCKYFDSYTTENVVACKSCEIRKQLQELGNQLIKKERKPLGEKKPVLDIDTYKMLTAQGKTDSMIAREYGISQPTISYHKKKWFKDAVEPSLKVVEAEKQPKPNKPSKMDVESEQRTLITELSEDITAKKFQIVKLEAKVEELENINAACSDVEEETDKLRNKVKFLTNRAQEAEGDYHDTLERLKQSDYALQNIKKTIERYEKENKALRELVSLWI